MSLSELFIEFPHSGSLIFLPPLPQRERIEVRVSILNCPLILSFSLREKEFGL
jgi:hypothetical protein